MTFTETLHRQHEELRAGIEVLRDAGDLIGEVATEVSRQEALAVIDFLKQEVLPETRREEEVVFPIMGRILGAAATRPLRREHLEVGVLMGRLERAIAETDLTSMRRLLYGLYHVLVLHGAQEAELFLPLLQEHLSRADAEEIAWRMGWEDLPVFA